MNFLSQKTSVCDNTAYIIEVYNWILIKKFHI